MVRYADDFVIGFEHRKVAEGFPGGNCGTAARVRGWNCIRKDAPDTVRRMPPSIDSGMGKWKPENLITFWVSRTLRNQHKRAFTYCGRQSASVWQRTLKQSRRTAQTDARALQGHRRLALRAVSGEATSTISPCRGTFPVAVVRHDVIRSWWQAVRGGGNVPCVVQCFDRIVAQHLHGSRDFASLSLERFCATHPR